MGGRSLKTYRSEQELLDKSEYGFHWYDVLWRLARPLLTAVCSLVLVAGLVSMGLQYIHQKYVAPVDAKDAAPRTFVVASGDSLRRVANNLEKQGLVRSGTFFKYYADFGGYGQKIQSGEYTLNKAMTVEQMLDQLTQGDGRPMVRRITLIPGWTIEDFAQSLVKQGQLKDSAVFLDKARRGEDYRAYHYVQDVLTQGGANGRRYALEGYLAADTYEFFANATEDDIIKKLLSQTETVFSDAFHQRAEELGMTMDQAITLASLIEKEAKKGDFARVSAVFHNRLKQGMPLGSDVTIKYALAVKRMVLTKEDLALSSPFNSYTHKGLPPGPVCTPSGDAIAAALYPDEAFLRENMLYFCSKNPDTGELHFSKTLQEHEQAVRIYAPLWAAFDQKMGYTK